MEFVCSEQAAQLVTVGAPCPDHLVHTKRLPLWIPRDQTDRIAELAQAYRDDYRAYFEAHADGDEPGDPDARIILVEGMGMVAAGTTVKASKISRDLYHRAIEVMAGAEALGEFVSLDAAESFAIEYWPLELYKLAQAPPPGELQGKVALVTGGAGGIGRAILDTLASAGACVVAFDLDEDGARDAVAEHDGLAVGGDVTSEAARRRRVRGRRARVRRPRHRGLERRHRVQRRARGDDARGVEPQPRDPRHRLLPRREGVVPDPQGAGRRRLDRLHRVQERARRGQERGRVLVGEGGRAAPRPLPRRRGRRAPGSASTP